MFSRLYLGVHSPADIVSGGIVGCIILALWIKVDNAVDLYISFGNNGKDRDKHLGRMFNLVRVKEDSFPYSGNPYTVKSEKYVLQECSPKILSLPNYDLKCVYSKTVRKCTTSNAANMRIWSYIFLQL